MHERTRRLWDKQDQHRGDRHRLFTAVAAAITADSVLYPGSYVDLATSFVWPSVTYVDIDRRAQQFFDDEAGVEQLLVEHDVEPNTHTVRFIKADYSDSLDLDESEFDLLISLYAGFVSEACTRHSASRRHTAREPEPRRRCDGLHRPEIPPPSGRHVAIRELHRRRPEPRQLPHAQA